MGIRYRPEVGRENLASAVLRNRGKITHRTIKEQLERLIADFAPVWIWIFVAVVMVFSWGLLFWGIWMDFTR